MRRAVPLLLSLAALLAGCGERGEREALPPGRGGPVLDGTRPLQRDALADLAIRRARMGGQWLARNLRYDESFPYWYLPRSNRIDVSQYNEVRHAGTTYSMFKVGGATGDREILAGGERSVEWIERNSLRLPGTRGRGFVFEGEVKLGGQALAIVALMERRRVTRDRRHDGLIRDLAEFMLSSEVRGQRGRMYPRYVVAGGEFRLDPPSDYYPGEALLALTRLAQQFPREDYEADANRVAQYLVHRRDGDIPRAGRVPREDQWLTLSLAELYRLTPDPDYRTVVYLQAQSMIDNQHRPPDPPSLIGASDERSPVNYTSTATKGEALASAWALSRFSHDAAREPRLALAAQRNAQFAMRVQYTPANTRNFPRPAGVNGAWAQDPVVPNVRMDFVQHNVSALTDTERVMRRGDLPIARPLPGDG